MADGKHPRRKNIEAVYKRLHTIAPHGTDMLQLNTLIMYRYELITKLGVGGHSEVYSAFDRLTRSDVAIKVERTDRRLINEAPIIRRLSSSDYFCDFIEFQQTPELHYIVMEMHGPDLRHILKYYRPLSWRTVINCGIQMLRAIQELHSIGFVHGDIKPSSFLTGMPPHKSNKLILIDFGISKRLKLNNITKRDTDLSKLPLHSEPTFHGSMKYASPSIHNGFRLCRRDDIWSLLYTILELANVLPWDQITRHDKVKEMKMLLVDGLIREQLGPELTPFKFHVERLTLPDPPNYEFINKCFQTALERNHATGPWYFEWEQNPHLVWNVSFTNVSDTPDMFLTDIENMRLVHELKTGKQEDSASVESDQSVNTFLSIDIPSEIAKKLISFDWEAAKAETKNEMKKVNKKRHRKHGKLSPLIISRLLPPPKDYEQNKAKYEADLLFFSQCPIAEPLQDEEAEGEYEESDDDHGSRCKLICTNCVCDPCNV